MVFTGVAARRRPPVLRPSDTLSWRPSLCSTTWTLSPPFPRFEIPLYAPGTRLACDPAMTALLFESIRVSCDKPWRPICPLFRIGVLQGAAQG
jgi:hypothetical protein